MSKMELKTKPLISIIIPAYNAEDCIYRSVNSALNQSYLKVEVIVVENGSTDRTRELLDEMQGIKVFHSEKGVSNARNMGIEKSIGDYVLFLDADDWLNPDAVEQLMMNVDNDIDIIAGRYVGDKPLENYIAKRYESGDKSYFSKCLKNPTKRGNVTAVLFKRNFIIENNIRFDIRLTHAEDSIFLLTALCAEPSVLDKEIPVYNVFINPKSTVRRKSSKAAEAYAHAAQLAKTLVEEYDVTLSNDVYIFVITQLLIIIVNNIAPDMVVANWSRLSKEVKAVCLREPYKQAIANADIKTLPFSRKTVFYFMKKKLYFLLLLAGSAKKLSNKKRSKKEVFIEEYSTVEGVLS